jgi:hypothetical protein
MIESETHRNDLIDEIERYLAAVDVFRALGCEPAWRPESAPRALAIEAPRASAQITSAH